MAFFRFFCVICSLFFLPSRAVILVNATTEKLQRRFDKQSDDISSGKPRNHLSQEPNGLLPIIIGIMQFYKKMGWTTCIRIPWLTGLLKNSWKMAELLKTFAPVTQLKFVTLPRSKLLQGIFYHCRKACVVLISLCRVSCIIFNSYLSPTLTQEM